MELMYQRRAGGVLKKKKKKILKGKQREGKQRKESILKKEHEKSNRGRLGDTKTGNKTELEVEEAEQQYNLEGQLIKYVAVKQHQSILLSTNQITA